MIKLYLVVYVLNLHNKRLLKQNKKQSIYRKTKVSFFSAQTFTLQIFKKQSFYIFYTIINEDTESSTLSDILSQFLVVDNVRKSVLEYSFIRQLYS